MKAEFAGTYEANSSDSAFYFVPSRTLLLREAEELGVAGERDLYGGVVPARFLSPKTINHRTLDAGAGPPPGLPHQIPGGGDGHVVRGLPPLQSAERPGLAARRLA